MKSAIIALFFTFTNLAFASAFCRHSNSYSYDDVIDTIYKNLDRNGSTVVCGSQEGLNYTFDCILDRFPKGFSIESIVSQNTYTCAVIKTKK